MTRWLYLFCVVSRTGMSCSNCALVFKLSLLPLGGFYHITTGIMALLWIFFAQSLFGDAFLVAKVSWNPWFPSTTLIDQSILFTGRCFVGVCFAFVACLSLGRFHLPSLAMDTMARSLAQMRVRVTLRIRAKARAKTRSRVRVMIRARASVRFTGNGKFVGRQGRCKLSCSRSNKKRDAII